MGTWSKKSLSDLVPQLNSKVLLAQKEALEKSVQELKEQAQSIENYLNNTVQPAIDLIRAKVQTAEDYLNDFKTSGIHFISYDELGGTSPESVIPNLPVNEAWATESARYGGFIFLTKSTSSAALNVLKAPLKKLIDFDNAVDTWKDYTIGKIMPSFNPLSNDSFAKKTLDKLKATLDSLEQKKENILKFLNEEVYPTIDNIQADINEILSFIDAIGKSGYYIISYDNIIGITNLKRQMQSDLEQDNTEGWNGQPETISFYDEFSGEWTQIPNPDYIPPLYPNAPTFQTVDLTSGVLILVTGNSTTYKIQMSLLRKVFGV